MHILIEKNFGNKKVDAKLSRFKNKNTLKTKITLRT